MDKRKPYDEVTIKLRKEGYGYSDIARMTGRESKSVKITCQRLGIEMTDISVARFAILMTVSM